MSQTKYSDLPVVATIAAKPRARSRPRRGKHTLFLLALLTPALLFYTLFLILPMLGTVVISFTDWTGISFDTLRFNGLDNFTAMAQDPFFWKALQNSFLFVVCALIFQVGLAFLAALLLESNIRLAEWFRSIFLIPSVLSLIVVGLLFSFILDPTIGLVDALLRSVGLHGPAFGWLGAPGVNIYVVIAIHIWREFGFTMFLLVAGLQALPGELLEAARLDGATPWQLTIRIIIPLIKEVLAVASLLASITAMRVFDLVYATTQGGPYHASETIVSYIYQLGLGTSQARQGYATAIALVLMLIIMAMSVLQWRLTRPDKSNL